MYSEEKLLAVLSKLPRQSVTRNCYRTIDYGSLHEISPPRPLWALGPGKYGQRYSPVKGPSALYVSEDINTSVAEVGSFLSVVRSSDPDYEGILPPLVLITIKVHIQHVLDVTISAIQAALGTSTTELTGSWEMQLARNLRCPTHILANAVYKSNRYQAIRYRSKLSNASINLIIWTEKIVHPSYLEVYDPGRNLTERIPH